MPVYADFPECLKRYDWLLDDSKNDVSKMFNQTKFPSCKVCGEDIPRKNWNDHRIEHLNSRIIRGKVAESEIDLSEFTFETFEMAGVDTSLTKPWSNEPSDILEDVNKFTEQIINQTPPKKLWL
jgi:hypothetical protein